MVGISRNVRLGEEGGGDGGGGGMREGRKRGGGGAEVVKDKEGVGSQQKIHQNLCGCGHDTETEYGY